jgi:hypothetical protein
VDFLVTIRPDRHPNSAVKSKLLSALLFLTPWAAAAGATITATFDTDVHLETPVPHRYVHGVILDHAKFQIALPNHWNGELAVFSRGFSGTELTTGSFKPTALAKGYAFAVSDEGWNRYTIAHHPEDSYYESRQRLWELTVYAKQLILAYYHRGPARTLMMGGSNGGHHTKWMVESFPDLYDGGIAGYGYMAQESQWGSVATVLRNYEIIEPRIDDIIAQRKSDPHWDPARTPLAPPLTAPQLRALQNIYDIPVTLQSGFQLNVGRWPGSEAEWKSQYRGLVGYLHDSMPRFDETFHPGGGPLTDDKLKLWDPSQSPKHIRQELAKLDLTGNLTRPILAMHGTADPIISPGEEVGYQALVEKRLGQAGAEQVLALYFIPGMGHGGTEYNNLIGAQIDALERWIDYRESGGKRGAPPPASLGGYPRSLGGVPGE